MSRRIHAILTENRFHGKPCGVCKNKTRHKGTNECVVCREARRKDRRARIAAGRLPHEAEDIKAMQSFAAKMGLKVDHIVPLTHPLVCGLHVLRNMQFLTALENTLKGNKFDEKQGIAPQEPK